MSFNENNIFPEILLLTNEVPYLPRPMSYKCAATSSGVQLCGFIQKNDLFTLFKRSLYILFIQFRVNFLNLYMVFYNFIIFAKITIRKKYIDVLIKQLYSIEVYVLMENLCKSQIVLAI
ncbi:hypothetical protein TRFO_16568 [Tritrichomonas foetus]|uniref:Uncharacterized protein n=1 Tax=Tritrichomonas foetus TaxID=1144522 RepID=A0A1J4KPU1_9EUKA|nr:hypothetical protein TRFO_16568 [Tritrichomonas foetus]|eukprot:OHT13259.1 hypothetical protein TRFO_16568 [Tritrichomonas foetus]